MDSIGIGLLIISSLFRDASGHLSSTFSLQATLLTLVEFLSLIREPFKIGLFFPKLQ